LEGGGDAFIDHQQWSPSCGFIKELFVGNIPIGSEISPSSQQTSRSYDVCGPFMELRPNSHLERSKYDHLYFGFYMYVFITVQKFSKLCIVFTAASFKMPERKNNTTQLDGPKYQHHSKHNVRMQSYATWSVDSKQKAENLSEAGFFYTGKKQFINKSLFIIKKYIFSKDV
jgi:hypothetical protein